MNPFLHFGGCGVGLGKFGSTCERYISNKFSCNLYTAFENDMINKVSIAKAAIHVQYIGVQAVSSEKK